MGNSTCAPSADAHAAVERDFGDFVATVELGDHYIGAEFFQPLAGQPGDPPGNCSMGLIMVVPVAPAQPLPEGNKMDAAHDFTPQAATKADDRFAAVAVREAFAVAVNRAFSSAYWSGNEPGRRQKESASRYSQRLGGNARPLEVLPINLAP